jgi:hypothetical protein
MRKWFKYGLAILALCLVIAFFSRERMTNMYPSSTPPEKPVKLLPPYGDILYTEGGPDVSPAPGQIGNDLPMGNA